MLSYLHVFLNNGSENKSLFTIVEKKYSNFQMQWVRYLEKEKKKMDPRLEIL